MAQDEVLNIAKQYADAVRKTMDTSAVYLYDSYAKGTASKDSDIDIAVIVDVIPADYLKTVLRKKLFCSYSVSSANRVLSLHSLFKPENPVRPVAARSRLLL